MQLFKMFMGNAGGNALGPADAKARLDSDNLLFILDVRQPEEFSAGHIAGAKLIPLNQLGQRLNELPTDRDILCVCQSGSRSSAAVQQLSSKGYKVLNLNGGMFGWQRAGYPIKKGK